MLLLLLPACLVNQAGYDARLADLTDDDGDGASEVTGDCDDADPAFGPHAAERCNERDDDCDGSTDEADDVVDAEWYADADGDGAGTGEPVITCDPPGGFAAVYLGEGRRLDAGDTSDAPLLLEGSPADGAFSQADAWAMVIGGATEAEGEAVAGPIDVNADGAADLLFGAFDLATTQGEAWLLYGRT